MPATDREQNFYQYKNYFWKQNAFSTFNFAEKKNEISKLQIKT